MTNDDFIILAEKVADGTASISEIALYNASYDSFQEDLWTWTEIGLDPTALKQESLARFWKLNAVTSEPINAKPTIKLWPSIVITAAVMAFVAIGIYFFNSSSFYDAGRNSKSVYLNDIAPGRNTATITLANGQTVNLSDAKTGVVIGDHLAYNDGTEIETSEGGNPASERELLTVITPRGGTYEVILPDGTKVWLNAASSLKFLSDFGGENVQQRKVELVGEAYFEVVKNAKRPFVVSSKGQQVTVLGTHFNISSYGDEDNTRTTLLEGSVRVNEMTLKPGQQSVLKGKELKVSSADIESAMAWKNGDFVFKGEDFKTTMAKIARWYDVDIIYETDFKDHIELGGWISRKSKLSEVLSRIESASDVHFKVEGRRVFVTK